jgi:hypothetical protein
MNTEQNTGDTLVHTRTMIRIASEHAELEEALRNLLSDATAADMDQSEWSGSLIEARRVLAKVRL